MIKIAVFGDFRAKNASKVVVSDEVKNILESSDFAICNFEAPISGGWGRIKKSGPVLDQDPASVEFLKSEGFNVVLLANNHIMDYGQEGCEKTKDAFSDVICVGAGEAKEAYQVRIVEKNGQKIGLLAFVQHEFGVVETPDDENGYGTAWINSPDIDDIIRESKKKVDYLIVFPHCGVEHVDAPLPEWRDKYKRLIRCGADLVIASHPHCRQGWEIYEGKYIYYSLGNFYFDELSHGEKWYMGLAVEIVICDKITTKAINIKFDDSGLIDVDNSLSSRTYVEKLCYLLENTEMYKGCIDKICRELFDNAKYNILRGIGGFSLNIRKYYACRLLLLMILGRKNKETLLNMFQNESHRWLIERYLKLPDIR